MGLLDDIDDLYRKMGQEPPERTAFKFEMPDFAKIWQEQEEKRARQHRLDEQAWASRRAKHNKEWHWKNMQKDMPTGLLSNSGYNSSKYAHKYVPGKKTYAAGLILGVGAAYGGYRLHKHFTQGKSQSKSYYYRRQNGKQIRVKNTKRKR